MKAYDEHATSMRVERATLRNIRLIALLREITPVQVVDQLVEHEMARLDIRFNDHRNGSAIPNA